MKVFSAESMVDFDKLERIKEERKKLELMEIMFKVTEKAMKNKRRKK